MSATGKVTLDASDYMKKLENMKKETGAAASEMSGKMRNMGRDISKASGTLSAFGSAAGKSFGALGNAIQTVAAGPIAIMTAAFGVLASVGSKIFDGLTLSAEEYAQKMDQAAKAADRQRQAVEKQQQTDAAYVERLNELSKLESLTNAERDEAVFMIQKLTSRYGELGYSINGVTGALEGATDAQKKFLERARQQKEQSIMGQSSANSAKIRAAAFNAAKGDGIWSNFYANIGLNKPGEQAASFMRMSNDQRIAQVEKLLNETSDSAQIRAFSEMLEMLYKQRDIENELNNIRDTGYAKEEEAAAEKKRSAEAARRAESAREQAARRANEEQIAAEEKLAETKKRNAQNESDYQFSIEQDPAKKIANRQARIAEEQKIIDEAKKKFDSADLLTLGPVEFDKLRTQMEQVIADAEQRKTLMVRQINAVNAAQNSAVPAVSASPVKFPSVSVPQSVNSLVARGAMMGGSASSAQDKLVSNTSQTRDILQRIYKKFDKIST